jgi:hypothetical protein
VIFFKEVLAEATFICGNWASFKQNAKSQIYSLELRQAFDRAKDHG